MKTEPKREWNLIDLFLYIVGWFGLNAVACAIFTPAILALSAPGGIFFLAYLFNKQFGDGKDAPDDGY